MNLAGGDSRERLLAAAWDEAGEPYPLPGCPELQLRPFSANALRRAASMDLRCLGGNFEEALAALRPRQALAELEALAWLLTADLGTVLGAMRSGTWARELERFELAAGYWKPFRAEMGRVLALVQAAMFDTEDKPKPPSPPGRGVSEEAEPPAHLLKPGILAGLAFALREKVGRPVDEVLEWVPACQLFQLAHCLQWGNSTIWTVDPSAISVEADAWAGGAPEADPGYGQEIAF